MGSDEDYMDTRLNLDTMIMYGRCTAIGCAVLKTLVAHIERKGRIPSAQSDMQREWVAHTWRKGRIPSAHMRENTGSVYPAQRGHTFGAKASTFGERAVEGLRERSYVFMHEILQIRIDMFSFSHKNQVSSAFPTSVYA